MVVSRIKKRIFSFKNAFKGLIFTFKNHPNFSLQITIALAVLMTAVIFRLNNVELAIGVLAITLVFSLELLNTAIETLTDMLVLRFDKRAEIIKNVSAGMVLTAAIGAVIIGILIFGPKFLITNN